MLVPEEDSRNKPEGMSVIGLPLITSHVQRDNTCESYEGIEEVGILQDGLNAYRILDEATLLITLWRICKKSNPRFLFSVLSTQSEDRLNNGTLVTTCFKQITYE